MITHAVNDVPTVRDRLKEATDSAIVAMTPAIANRFGMVCAR
jgi:hypothetical protein